MYRSMIDMYEISNTIRVIKLSNCGTTMLVFDNNK